MTLRTVARLVAVVTLLTVTGGCGHQGPEVVATTHTFRGELRQFTAPVGYEWIPDGIIAGPNRHMWYVLRSATATAIGEIGDDGSTVVHPLPGPTSEIHALVLGPDDAVWFTMTVGGTPGRTVDTVPDLAGGYGAVGRMAGDGRVDEFPMPDRSQVPDQIATFVGELWVSAHREAPLSQVMWRVTTGGSYTPTASPGQITRLLGTVNSLWYATDLMGPNYHAYSGIGQIDAGGRAHPTTLPDALQGDTTGIAIGPDHAPWYVISRRIVRVGPDGTAGAVTPLPCGGAVTSTSHDLWCGTVLDLYQISANGTVATHSARPPGAFTVLGSSTTLRMIFGAATAADGTVWFTDPQYDRILHYL